MTTTPAHPPVRLLELVEIRTAALLEALRGLDDADMRAPSRLPGWSRGHVLTHLARNGDAMLNAFSTITTGHRTPMYPSRDARDADIEAGSGRPADALRDDVAASSAHLMRAAGAVPADAWANSWQRGPGSPELPGTVIPVLRLGEVELHWHDLGLAASPNRPDAWPGEWVGAALPGMAADLDERAGEPLRLRCTDTGRAVAGDRDGRTIMGTQAELLAWVAGRSDGAHLVVEPGGALPDLGPWR